MLSRWPILFKLLLGVAMLLLIVVTLSFSGFSGVYAFRQLARTTRFRATELPLAAELTQSVSELRVTVVKLRRSEDNAHNTLKDPVDPLMLREEFRTAFLAVRESLTRYKEQLKITKPSDYRIADKQLEEEKVQEIEQSLRDVEGLNHPEDWVLLDIDGTLDDELENLQRLTSTLPGFMNQRMHDFAGEARMQYRTWIALCWITSILAVVTLILAVVYFHIWIIAPLKVLIDGSRRVARGNFDHRIRLKSKDEVAELANAMNDMTARFQEIRDDLDRQVKQRTKEVVRSEQLASVGFLAAGVAHEINNPLASIAWAAESLQDRLQDVIKADDELPDDQHNPEIKVLRTYLKRIQDEAFRCSGITERLLDYSRMGDVERQDTNLGELVEGVIEMVRHLGKYREKHIEFNCRESTIAAVNPQEFKQVILNLITNGLDSVDVGGTLTIDLTKTDDTAELNFADNGCGMTQEVLENLFEPFFTRRRDGQGTGLGLSITYSIVAEHGGIIEATSDGPGHGSRFHVTLPLVQHENEVKRKYQVA